MTPEDWQRLWQDDGGDGPRHSRADLLARAQILEGHWRYLRWFYFSGAMFLVIGSLRGLEWTRTGATVTLTLAVLHMAFGLGFIVHAWIWSKATGRLPTAVSVVQAYRQMLETERARLRQGVMIGIIGAAQIFVAFLAMTPILPSLATRVTMGAAGVVLLSWGAWLRFGFLGKQLAELRTLPPDDPSAGSGS